MSRLDNPWQGVETDEDNFAKFVLAKDTGDPQFDWAVRQRRLDQAIKEVPWTGKPRFHGDFTISPNSPLRHPERQYDWTGNEESLREYYGDEHVPEDEKGDYLDTTVRVVDLHHPNCGEHGVVTDSIEKHPGGLDVKLFNRHSQETPKNILLHPDQLVIDEEDHPQDGKHPIPNGYFRPKSGVFHLGKEKHAPEWEQSLGL